MNWTPTSSGHEVSLLDGKLVARNSAGRRLESVPAAAEDDPVVIGLRHVLEWLGRHEVACAAQVETWMVHSLPVPLTVLQGACGGEWVGGPGLSPGASGCAHR